MGGPIGSDQTVRAVHSCYSWFIARIHQEWMDEWINDLHCFGPYQYFSQTELMER